MNLEGSIKQSIFEEKRVTQRIDGDRTLT